MTRDSPELGRRRGRVHLSACARTRRRLRADPASAARGQASRCRRMDRVARPGRGPRGDARAPLCIRTRPSPGRRTGRRSPHRASAARDRPPGSRGPCVVVELPSTRPSASTRRLSALGPWMTPTGRSSSSGAHEPSACWEVRVRERRSRKPETRSSKPGDSERAAEADALLTDFWWYRRQPRSRAIEHLDRAHSLVATAPTVSRQGACAESGLSVRACSPAENEDAIRIGREALAMAEELGLGRARAHALDQHRPLQEQDLGRSDEP